MPSTVVDTAAAPPLKPTRSRSRSAALSNSNTNAGAPETRAKTVASRYLAPFSKPASISRPTATSSATTSRRSASPATSASREHREASAERALLPDATAAVNAADSGASTTATTPPRTLSVAFQSPTYCLDTSRARPVSPATPAAFSPEERNSSTVPTSMRAKVSDGNQNAYRWSASATSAPSGDASAAARLGYPVSNCKWTATTTSAVRRSTAHDATPRRASVDGANEYLHALSSEDTDSASSGGSRDGRGYRTPGVASSGPRAARRSVFLSSSARFSRDAVGTRSDRFSYPPKPVSSSRSPADTVASPSPVKKRSLFNGLLSSPFNKLSLKQQPLPSKPVGSSLRMTNSPSRARRSVGLPDFAGKQQGKAWSLDGDMKKVKTQRPTKAEEEHQLKLVYTRYLQWRHANAQAAAALSSQRAAAEKAFYGAWISMLRARKSVAIAKMQLQVLRNNCKLMAILRGHMIHLEEWSSLEKVYANSLSGTTQALNATVVRLPVSDGAKADIQALKNCVGSAVEVMQRITNSTSAQLSKLAEANVLVSQLSTVAMQELVLMAQCRELLSKLASMQVRHCSLQGQWIQLNQMRNRGLQ